MLKQEEIIKNSQDQILKLHSDQSKSQIEQPCEAKSETFKKLLDDIDRKESIITALDQKLSKLSEELEKEKEKTRTLEDSLKSVREIIASKDNESALCARRVEELIDKKNKLQKECSTLRTDSKGLATEKSQLEKECDDLKKQIIKMQDDSRAKVDELRNSLKKNSALLKQVSVRCCFCS